MAIQPQIAMQGRMPNTLGAVQTGQSIAREAAMQPLDVAAALNKNEQDNLNLAEAKRQEAFKQWIGNNPPVRDANNQIDIGTTMQKMYDAGFGQYANQAWVDHQNRQLQTVTNAETLRKAATDAAVQAAQGLKNASQDDKKKLGAKAEEFILNQYKISPSQIFGTKDWIDVAGASTTSVMAERQQTVSEAAQSTSEQDRNPNSQKSKDARAYVESATGTTIPKTASLSDLRNNPMYRDYADQFVISNQTRVGELKSAEANSLSAQRIGDLESGIKNWELQSGGRTGYKPTEYLSNLLQRLTNNEDRAVFSQLQAELKANNIEINDRTTVQGALDALNRKKNEYLRASEAGKKVSTAPNIKSAAESVGKTETKVMVGDKFVDTRTGKIYTFSKDRQSSPQIIEAIRSGVLKKAGK